MQSFVAFYLAVTELLDFKLGKTGQNLYANMEGFRIDGHIYTLSPQACSPCTLDAYRIAQNSGWGGYDRFSELNIICQYLNFFT